jgi:hypothetical protein
MMILPIRVKLANEAAVQRPHDPNARLVNYFVDMSATEQTAPNCRFQIFPVSTSWQGGIMDAFERMCLGSALTGFVILVVTTLTLFVAS